MEAIDGAHITIAKPRVGASNYYYFKPEGYTMNCQAVVDSLKRFLDLYVGIYGCFIPTFRITQSQSGSLMFVVVNPNGCPHVWSNYAFQAMDLLFLIESLIIIYLE